jgi:NADPH:quinone reductase-like Zn-dependent oxidoreductase
MALPTTARVYRRTEDSKDIELSTESLPKDLAPTEVLIQIHAVSLNFRDVAMINDRYPRLFRRQCHCHCCGQRCQGHYRR